MTPFQQLDSRNKTIEVARWVAVLPAAALGRFTVDLLLRLLSGIAQSFWCLPYLLSTAAFVATGSYVAPRARTATAVTLTAVSAGLSLLKHVIGQHLTGNRVGTTNYLHAGLELAGALAGLVLIVMRQRSASGATRE